MNRAFFTTFVITLCFLIFALYLPAQETASSGNEISLDWDIDSLFNEPEPETPEQSVEKRDEPSSSSAIKLLTRRGFTFDASFQFIAGAFPGWNQAPWHFDGDKDYSSNPSAEMKAGFVLDAQISEVFRVKTSFSFAIPGTSSNLQFKLKEFFFDYSFYDMVFMRGGKYSLSWGISRNYAFTNLLSRVPDKKYNRDPFILKFDIPLGIGGFQLLALTRANLMGGKTPTGEDVAYGGKYNLAHSLFDMDVGVFYQQGMDMRGFLSLKTTLWDIEFYNEYLGAFNVEKWNGFGGAVNLGLARDFFDRKLSLNAEVFYNAEKNAVWFSPETDIKDSEIYAFLEGFNLAFNLLFRFGGKGNPRLFMQALYAAEQDSARIIPGFRLSPWSHIDLYFAVPVSLGSKNGYYYYHNEDKYNRPFSIVLLATIKGSVRAAYYQ